MKRSLAWIMVVTFAMLSGCNNRPKTAPPPPQLPPMIQDQKQVLDSAKGMSDSLDKQAEAQRERIDEATK